MSSKTCRVCGRVFEETLDNFYLSHVRRDGSMVFRSKCIACHNDDTEARRDPERRRAYQRDWRIKRRTDRPGEEAAYKRAYRARRAYARIVEALNEA